MPSYKKGDREKYRLSIAKNSWARRFVYSRLGGWAIACSPIMGTTVREDRLRLRGYIPFLEYYLKVKYNENPKPKSRKRK